MFVGLFKLVVLGGMVFLIWYAFRWINRIGKAGVERARARVEEAARAQSAQPGPAVTDLRPCPVCGDHVLASGAQNCGKPGCPYGAR
jgi:hypothetical protein